MGCRELVVVLFLVLQYLMRELICYSRSSFLRPSIYFSFVVKSCLNLFLDPASTKHLG